MSFVTDTASHMVNVYKWIGLLGVWMKCCLFYFWKMRIRKWTEDTH